MEEVRGECCPLKVGKTYRIYHPDAILKRRKAAGLEWVIRTKGVAFVDPATGILVVPDGGELSGTDSVPGPIR
jgi:hypothetical protein